MLTHSTINIWLKPAKLLWANHIFMIQHHNKSTPLVTKSNKIEYSQYIHCFLDVFMCVFFHWYSHWYLCSQCTLEATTNHHAHIRT